MVESCVQILFSVGKIKSVCAKMYLASVVRLCVDLCVAIVHASMHYK